MNKSDSEDKIKNLLKVKSTMQNMSSFLLKVKSATNDLEFCRKNDWFTIQKGGIEGRVRQHLDAGVPKEICVQIVTCLEEKKRQHEEIGNQNDVIFSTTHFRNFFQQS